MPLGLNYHFKNVHKSLLNGIKRFKTTAINAFSAFSAFFRVLILLHGNCTTVIRCASVSGMMETMHNENHENKKGTQEKSASSWCKNFPVPMTLMFKPIQCLHSLSSLSVSNMPVNAVTRRPWDVRTKHHLNHLQLLRLRLPSSSVKRTCSVNGLFWGHLLHDHVLTHHATLPPSPTQSTWQHCTLLPSVCDS